MSSCTCPQGDSTNFIPTVNPYCPQHGEKGTKTKDDLVKSLREMGYGVLLYHVNTPMSNLHRDMINMMLDQIFIAGMERHVHPVCDVFGNDRREELVDALMKQFGAIMEGASHAS